YPGIEVSWQIRNAKLFAAPFRVDHAAKDQYWGKSASKIKAGHFTRQLAIPWHSDFHECSSMIYARSTYSTFTADLFGWWPAQRPDHVKPESAEAIDDEEAKTSKTRVDWFRPSSGAE